MDAFDIETFSGSSTEFDNYIDWKGGSIAVLKHYKLDTITRGAHMQRQFTIDLRVDFADQEKLEALKQTLRQAARHCYATAMLISDNPKTTAISIYSEDFFTANQEIKLLDDVIQQGLDATHEETSGAHEVSDELTAAVTNG